MPAHSVAPPAAPYAADHRPLARLLTDVEADAHARGWGQAASLLRVEPEDGRLAVAARSLPRGVHPAAALLGLRAPASWRAVGVVAEGRARRTGRSADAGTGTGTGTGEVDPPGPGSAPDGPSRRHAGDDHRPTVGTGTGEVDPPGPGSAPDGPSRRHAGDDHRPTVGTGGAAGGEPAGGPEGDGGPPVDGEGEASSPVRVAVLAARDGLVASVVRVDGDPPSVAVHHVAPTAATTSSWHDARSAGQGGGPGPAPLPPPPGAPTGRLVDLLLRALGLPTAPPPGSTTRLWAILWLEAVAAVAHAVPGLPWPVVAALHPARRILSGGPPPVPGAMPEAPFRDGSRARATGGRSSAVPATEPPGAARLAPRPGSAVVGGGPVAPAGSTPLGPGAVAGPAGRSGVLAERAPREGTRDDAATTATSVASLVAAGTAAGGLVGWARLHADAAAGRWPAPGLTATEAGWLDSGAFARWVLGDLPPLGVIAEAAAAHLHPSVATTVDQVLAAWGLGGGRAA